MRSSADSARVESEPLQINRLQVAQHADQDVPRADRLQVLRRNLDRLAVDLGQARTNLIEGQNRAIIKRIDDELAAFIDCLDQEMSREADAKEAQAEAAANFEVKNGERDWNAPAAIEDFIQKRVARVGVFLAIALEALLLEQKMRQELDLLDGVVAHLDDHLGLARKRCDFVEIFVGFEVGYSSCAMSKAPRAKGIGSRATSVAKSRRMSLISGIGISVHL